MKKGVTIILAICMFSSCSMLDLFTYKKYIYITEYANDYYWEGSLNNKTYTLNIDSIADYWFWGQMTVSNQGTYKFYGYDKHFMLPLTSEKPVLKLYSNSRFHDTIAVGRSNEPHPFFPFDLTLLKKRKNTR